MPEGLSINELTIAGVLVVGFIVLWRHYLTTVKEKDELIKSEQEYSRQLSERMLMLLADISAYLNREDERDKVLTLGFEQTKEKLSEIKADVLHLKEIIKHHYGNGP